MFTLRARRLETSAMTKPKYSRTFNPYFDISVRVWSSDTQKIELLLREIAINCTVNSIENFELSTPIKLTDLTYYSSSKSIIALSEDAINESIENILVILETTKPYINSGLDLDITIWISGSGSSMPRLVSVGPELIQRLDSIDIELFYEDFGDCGDGNPRRTWLRRRAKSYSDLQSGNV